jgi:predicted amidohydrolase
MPRRFRPTGSCRAATGCGLKIPVWNAAVDAVVLCDERRIDWLAGRSARSEVGAPGDVSVLELVEGPVEFVDTRNNKCQGKVQLRPANVVLAGVPFGRPYQSPFAVR